MFLLEEYKLQHRRSMEHYRQTRALGLFPMGVALMMMYAKGAQSGPGLWAALGVSLGLEMILWSGRNLHDHRRGRTRAGDWLVKNTDRWYPAFLTLIRGAFVGITLFILWLAATELGMRVAPLQHVIVVLLFILLPLRRVAMIRQRDNPTRAGEAALVFGHYSLIILITLFVGTAWHLVLIPNGRPLSGELPMGAIAVWVPCIMVIITCLVLCIDHIVRRQPLRQESQPPSEIL